MTANVSRWAESVVPICATPDRASRRETQTKTLTANVSCSSRKFKLGLTLMQTFYNLQTARAVQLATTAET